MKHSWYWYRWRGALWARSSPRICRQFCLLHLVRSVRSVVSLSAATEKKQQQSGKLLSYDRHRFRRRSCLNYQEARDGQPSRSGLICAWHDFSGWICMKRVGGGGVLRKDTHPWWRGARERLQKCFEKLFRSHTPPPTSPRHRGSSGSMVVRAAYM